MCKYVQNWFCFKLRLYQREGSFIMPPPHLLTPLNNWRIYPSPSWQFPPFLLSRKSGEHKFRSCRERRRRGGPHSDSEWSSSRQQLTQDEEEKRVLVSLDRIHLEEPPPDYGQVSRHFFSTFSIQRWQFVCSWGRANGCFMSSKIVSNLAAALTTLWVLLLM